MKRPFLLTCISLIWTIALSAQTTFYAMETDSKSPRNLISYDYITSAYKRIISVPIKDNYYGYTSALDQFNKHYFFVDISRLPNLVYTIDIASASMNVDTLPAPDRTLGIEYNPFHNSLLCYSSIENKRGFIYEYFLQNGSYTVIDSLMDNTGPFGVGIRAFNTLSAEVVSTHAVVDSTVYYSVDLIYGQVNRRIKRNEPYGSVLYNKLGDEYVLFFRGEDKFLGSMSTDLQKLDTGCMLPVNMQVIGESRQNIDPVNHKYLLPLWNDSSRTHFLHIYDLATCQLDTVLMIPKNFYLNHLYADSLPGYCQRGDTLIAYYGKDYQWYRNGKPVKNTKGQKFVPDTLQGSFSVEVTNESGIKRSSGTRVFTNLSNKRHISSCLFPNPMQDRAQLMLSQPLQESAVICLYNSSGRLVFTKKLRPGEPIIIERNQLTAGLYFYSLSSQSKVIASGKMIIAD